MEEMMNVLRRKSQIIYDMNCIEKYIQAKEHDENLSKAWRSYKAELEEVEIELRLLSNPNTKVLEEQKLALCHLVEDHKKEIRLLEHQIEDIEKHMMAVVL